MNRPHRLLLVTQEYSAVSAGGAGEYAYELAGALAAGGIEVHLLAPGSASRREVAGPNLILHWRRVINWPLLRVPSFHWQVWRSTRRLIRQERIDTIHSNNNAGLMAAGRPLHATVHHPIAAERPFVAWRQRLVNLPDQLFERLIIRRAVSLSVPSHLVADLLASRYPRHAAKVRVSLNGVNQALFRPGDSQARARLVQRYGFASDAVIALVPGGARARRKGALDLLAALQLVPAGKPYHLIVTGQVREAGWGDELQAQLAASGLATQIRLPGEINYDDLPGHFQGADLVVFPSQFEGFGIPILEAQASGRALLATATGEAPYLVNESTGILVAPGDIASLAAGFTRLLGDAGLRSRLGRAAHQAASQYSWHHTAHRLVQAHQITAPPQANHDA